MGLSLATAILLTLGGPERSPAERARSEVRARLEQADRAFAAERWAEARGHYEALLPLLAEPLTVTVREQIARCHGREGRADRELEQLQVLLDRHPQDMTLRARMAAIALAAGMPARGEALLRSLDESQVRDAVAYFNVGAQFMNHGRAEDAVRYFAKAIALDPALLDAYFQRGFAYLQLGRQIESRSDFRRVLALAPPDSLQARTAIEALASIR